MEVADSYSRPGLCLDFFPACTEPLMYISTQYFKLCRDYYFYILPYHYLKQSCRSLSLNELQQFEEMKS
jgi:hypothetical protein